MSDLTIAQDKSAEVEFFDAHAGVDAYDVFTPASNRTIIEAFQRLTGLAPGATVADLGCGSGVFSDLLYRAGYKVTAIDISPRLIEIGRNKYPDVRFDVGDVEALPFTDASVDGVMLSGIVHHLPDASRCAAEVFRVLRPAGRFMAFDPNRMNPFMYLYRDRTSPFYSSVGVTRNERPVMAEQTAAAFRSAGFVTSTEFLSGLSYRYVASATARLFLPIYNAIDSVAFALRPMRRFRSFVLTYGSKPD